MKKLLYMFIYIFLMNASVCLANGVSLNEEYGAEKFLSRIDELSDVTSIYDRPEDPNGAYIGIFQYGTTVVLWPNEEGYVYKIDIFAPSGKHAMANSEAWELIMVTSMLATQDPTNEVYGKMVNDCVYTGTGTCFSSKTGRNYLLKKKNGMKMTLTAYY